MLPFLVTFVALTPEFTTILMTNPTALSRFLRQVVTNGFPVVFLVNYIGFVVSSGLLQKVNQSALRHIIPDTFARAGAFVVLHVLIYVFSADWFGSFGGDRWTALRVVGPTLARSYLFENISGVYLYALLPGVVITYWPAMPNSEGTNDSPFATRQIIVIIGACLSVVLVVTVLSTGLTQLLGR